MLNPNLQSQASLAAQHAGAGRRQDSAVPLLINTRDARLVPNVPNVRRLPEYRPYHGAKDASLEARLAYIRSGGGAPAVTATTSATAFDISKASKPELVDFAANEYGVALEDGDVRTMRRKLAELAEAAGTLA